MKEFNPSLLRVSNQLSSIEIRNKISSGMKSIFYMRSGGLEQTYHIIYVSLLWKTWEELKLISVFIWEKAFQVKRNEYKGLWSNGTFCIGGTKKLITSIVRFGISMVGSKIRVVS